MEAKIISVNFDETIVEDAYPVIGNLPLIRLRNLNKRATTYLLNLLQRKIAGRRYSLLQKETD